MSSLPNNSIKEDIDIVCGKENKMRSIYDTFYTMVMICEWLDYYRNFLSNISLRKRKEGENNNETEKSKHDITKLKQK